MKNFRDLEVWTHAHKLTLNAYQRTRDFPSDERFGITSQIRGDAEFHRFLQMAMGSASELEYHLLLARDLNYLKAEHHATIEQETVRAKRMLASLLSKVDEDREKSRTASA